MRTMVKGFLGAAMMIAMVASLGGYVYAQPLRPVPLMAEIPNTTDWALMELKINAQCAEQETEVITGTTLIATTAEYTNTEKDIIELLSKHTDACVARGAFPAHPNKARLYYQFSAPGFVVKVSDGTSTADISESCMAIIPRPPVYMGSENVDAAISSAKFSLVFEMSITINITGTASENGWVMTLTGAGKEKLNLPKLNAKGKQTLTDSWSFVGHGLGTAYALTTPKTVFCTATAQGRGTFKR